jgi:hypothetical protein
MSAIEVAFAGGLGALGGSIVAPLIQAASDRIKSESEERRHLQDVRRDSYGAAVAWLLELRDKAYSTTVYLFIPTNATNDNGETIDLGPQIKEGWDAVSKLVVEGLPSAMVPVIRVASDKVIDAYKRLSGNSTFWPGADSGLIVDDEESLLGCGLSREEMMRELKLRARPMTSEEVRESKLSSAKGYIKSVDAFIHLLRTEVGLSKGSDISYLSPMTQGQE